MATTTDQSSELVRFGRRQTRGLLLGLSGIRVAAIVFALACLVGPLFLAGAVGAVLAMPLWASALTAAFVRWNGRPAVESVPVVGKWATRSAIGQTRYLARPSCPRPAGTMALPGVAASLRFHRDPVSGAAMIHDPHRGTLAVVVHVTHPAYVLLSPDDQRSRVAGWSRALADLAASGTCAGMQVLETTLPDPGHGVRAWYASHGTHDGSWPDRNYTRLMDQQSVGSSTHRTTVTLVLDLCRAARAIRDGGRGLAGASAVLRAYMAAFETSLRSADLRAQSWLSPEALALGIRQAYDPAVTAMTTSSPGADLATAGPVALEEHWDHLRHDSGFSAVLWVSEWPRVDVAPHFLHALVFAPEVRKSLSIVARPLGTAEALRQIRKEKVEYVTDAAQKSRLGQLADLSHAQEYHDVLDRERALISGHADMEYSGFVAVTAGDRDGLAAAVSVIERAAT
jgi:hypothetical protein